MADVTNVQIGVAELTFGGVNLGHTKGGVTVSYEPEYHDLTVDKYGNTVIDKILIGEKLSVTAPLAEYTIDNLAIAIPNSTKAGTDKRVTIGSLCGKKSSEHALELVVHPVNIPGRDYDVVLYKAVVEESVELPHNFDEEKIMEITFTALIDEGKADGNYLGLIGDSAA